MRTGEEDDEVLRELRSTLEILDPVPDGLTERVGIRLTLAALDAELAELTAPELLAVRSGDPDDTLSFDGPHASLLVTASEDEHDTVRLDGWCTVPGASVEVYAATQLPAVGGRAVAVTTADEHGRLSIPRLVTQRVLFVIRDPRSESAAVTVTPLVAL